jgi:tyrosyl-tRNA synthetase
MTTEQRIELITKNTAEVVTENELANLLDRNKHPVVYDGFEPSGKGLHIGTLIGINKLMDFQKAGLRLKILLADLHGWLNEKGSLSRIEKIAELYKEGFAALGVNLRKAKVVYGSDFQLGYEYMFDVLKLATKIRLLRAKRAMTIIGREERDPKIAQVVYPLMQVIDIKALKADIAFGGIDQRKIHMLARENLPQLEYKTPIALHHELMVGLTGSKMSSSVQASHIMIDEQPEEIRKRILNAFCPAKQIANNPILQICKHIIFQKLKEFKIEREKKFGGDVTFKSYEELEKTFIKGLHPFDLKKATAESLIKILEPVRKHMSRKRVRKIKEILKGLS